MSQNSFVARLVDLCTCARNTEIPSSCFSEREVGDRDRIVGQHFKTFAHVWRSVPESRQLDLHQQWWLFNGVLTTSKASLTAASYVLIRLTHAVVLRRKQTDYCTALAAS